MFLNCPAYLSQEDALRCGPPAEVRYRFNIRPTGGPLESATIRCPVGHCFSGPIESLSLDADKHDPGPAPGGSREARRPNSAPAYYLGRSARQWITIMMSPLRTGSTSSHQGPWLARAAHDQWPWGDQ